MRTNMYTYTYTSSLNRYKHIYKHIHIYIYRHICVYISQRARMYLDKGGGADDLQVANHGGGTKLNARYAGEAGK